MNPPKWPRATLPDFTLFICASPRTRGRRGEGRTNLHRDRVGHSSVGLQYFPASALCPVASKSAKQDVLGLPAQWAFEPPLMNELSQTTCLLAHSLFQDGDESCSRISPGLVCTPSWTCASVLEVQKLKPLPQLRIQLQCLSCTQTPRSRRFPRGRPSARVHPLPADRRSRVTQPALSHGEQLSLSSEALQLDKRSISPGTWLPGQGSLGCPKEHTRSEWPLLFPTATCLPCSL